MARRYLFLCPDSRGPSGGVAVIYDSVAFLRQCGHDAVLVHMSPNGRYTNTPHDLPTFYTPEVLRTWRHYAGRLERLRGVYKTVRARIGAQRNPRIDPGPDDILVVPEMMFSAALEAFPTTRKVIFVQNPFGYTREMARALRRGLDPVRTVVMNIGIADICMEAFELSGASPVARCPVAPNLALFPFAEEKRRKIAFMPRKRRDEAVLLEAALRRRGNIEGYELVAIEGMTQAEVATNLGESIIFISLMQREALGFPGMEAMAAGCLVIGFTGLGTEEYFDDDTGIPVPEGHLMGVVTAVEAAVARHREDPDGFDTLRRTASQRIRQNYAPERCQAALKSAFERIEAALSE